jgi:hypothetical protein
MSKTGPIKVLETMQGSSYLTIESALKTLERWGLDVPNSTITVLRDKETPVVVVERMTPGTGAAERHGARVEPDVELTADEVNRLTSAPDPAKAQDKIQGSSLPAIRVAAEVFRKKIPDLSGYRIALMSEGDSRIVAFTDKDAPPGSRGGGGTRLGFEVEMNARDLVVRRSNFIR